MPRDDLYLVEMVEAIRHVQSFIAEVTVDQWLGSELVRSAVLQKLTVIGEAARGLSDDVRARHPDVPWSRLRGLRNVVVHEYFAVEWPRVWQIAREDAPALEPLVRGVLAAEFPEVAARLVATEETE